MKVCFGCKSLFLDGKHLADHQMSSVPCSTNLEQSETTLELDLRDALINHRPFLNLNVEFSRLDDLVLTPEYAVLCGDEHDLRVMSNGYTFKCRNIAAYLENNSHDIRLHCENSNCQAYGSLIGRHSITRLELVMFLRSKKAHNHAPDMLGTWTEEQCYFESIGSVTIGAYKYSLKSTIEDGSAIYKCNCCPKLLVKQGLKFLSDSKTIHWNRISQADLTHEVPKRCSSNPSKNGQISFDVFSPGYYNLEYGISKMKEYLLQNSLDINLKSLVKVGCQAIASIHKPGHINSFRPHCMIPGSEDIIRFDSYQLKLIRLVEEKIGKSTQATSHKKWKPICENPECFNIVKEGITRCTTHLRTVIEISVYKVSCADMYYVGKRRYGCADKGDVYVFDDIEDTISHPYPKNEVGALQKTLNRNDFHAIHRVEFKDENREEKSLVFSNSLKLYLQLFAVARDSIGKKTVLLNWSFSGPFDWELVEELLVKSLIRVYFEPVEELEASREPEDNMSRPASASNHKAKVAHTKCGQFGYLYVLNLENTGYIGYSEVGIADVHSRSAYGTSLDSTSWGKHLRDHGTTLYEAEVFAKVPKTLGLSLESLAILAFELGRSRGLSWNRQGSKPPLRRITNVKFQLPNNHMDRFQHLVTFTRKFFQRNLIVSVEGGLDDPSFY